MPYKNLTQVILELRDTAIMGLTKREKTRKLQMALMFQNLVMFFIYVLVGFMFLPPNCNLWSDITLFQAIKIRLVTITLDKTALKSWNMLVHIPLGFCFLLDDPL